MMLLPIHQLTFGLLRDAPVGAFVWLDARGGVEGVIGVSEGKTIFVMLTGQFAGSGYDLKENDDLSATWVADTRFECDPTSLTAEPADTALLLRPDGLSLPFKGGQFDWTDKALVCPGDHDLEHRPQQRHFSRWQLVTGAPERPVVLFAAGR
jgi:hypothetical protein